MDQPRTGGLAEIRSICGMWSLRNRTWTRDPDGLAARTWSADRNVRSGPNFSSTLSPETTPGSILAILDCHSFDNVWTSSSVPLSLSTS
ncbi:hypothetical protein KC19_VG263900 [Ceratodon purpureus]|uniref:Uncharacterized protein n=1 Tax=Ceratodon purpureus TaxID=3225 RepID=A0A8T0HUQ8_CERPU|nr:hypothetical protein KC19_VG263900 [Ceratodon purpureus]